MGVVLGFVIGHGPVSEVEAGIAITGASNCVGNSGEDWKVGGDWMTGKLSIPPNSIL
jgi:hypothetical protein